MFDVGSRNLLSINFTLFSVPPLICSTKTHTANDRHTYTTSLWVDSSIVKLRVDITSSLDIALLFLRCILTLPSQMYSNEWYLLLMQNSVQASLTEVLFFCCSLDTDSNGANWINRSSNRLSSRHDNVNSPISHDSGALKYLWSFVHLCRIMKVELYLVLQLIRSLKWLIFVVWHQEPSPVINSYSPELSWWLLLHSGEYPARLN